MVTHTRTPHTEPVAMAESHIRTKQKRSSVPRAALALSQDANTDWNRIASHYALIDCGLITVISF